MNHKTLRSVLTYLDITWQNALDLDAVQNATVQNALDFDTVQNATVQNALDFDTVLSAVCINSKLVKQHALFISLSNDPSKQYASILEALQNNAAVILHQNPNLLTDIALHKKLNLVIAKGKNSTLCTDNLWQKKVCYVPNLFAKWQQLVNWFYGQPDKNLSIIGVTGTNGKTSCCHFIRQILNRLNFPCASIGTLGMIWPQFNHVAQEQGNDSHLNHVLQEQVKIISSLTTPDYCSLMQMMYQAVNEKVRYIAMEVSSHALDQNRIANTKINIGLFTNLSQDHLDYHGNMDNYFIAKVKLFTDYNLSHCIINLDDEYGYRLLNFIPQGVKIYGYSLNKLNATNNINKLDIKSNINKLNATNNINKLDATSNINKLEDFITWEYQYNNDYTYINSKWGKINTNVDYPVEFFYSNVLASIIASSIITNDFIRVVAQIPHLLPVPGRMEKIKIDTDKLTENININADKLTKNININADKFSVNYANLPQVIVDFAHTPSALVAVLQSLIKKQQVISKENHIIGKEKHMIGRENSTVGKIWCVFGCGGERDASKRALMFTAACKYSDYIVLTEDNSRSESPTRIIMDMLYGQFHSKIVHLIYDRIQAINFAINRASKYDTILIAGRGHETMQYLNNHSRPLNDSKVAAEALSNKSFVE